MREKISLCLKIEYQELKVIYKNIIREKFPLLTINTLEIKEGIYEPVFDNIPSSSYDGSTNTFSNDTSNIHQFYSIKLIYKDSLNNSNTSNDFQKPIILTNNNSISQDDNAFYVFIENNQNLLINTLEFYKQQSGINQIRVEAKTKAITLKMLRQVFNGVKDSESKKIKILQEIANELNRIHEDGKPMYVHYKLDTKNRLEHFFAQSYVEVGGNNLILEERLNYSAKALIDNFSYYSKNQERIKEALEDGRVVKIDDYKAEYILTDKTKKSIEALVQDYIKNYAKVKDNTISSSTNITAIEANLGADSQKKFNRNKDYSPIELIETFKEYQSYATIQLAFKHAKLVSNEGQPYQIPYRTTSNTAFIIITQAIFDNIVNKRSNKRAKQVILANKIYNDNNKDENSTARLGNTQENDGYNFRGRGLLHLTGRDNYTNFQAYYNKNYPNNQKDFINNENHRNELITNTAIALISAVWFWTRNKAYQLADKQDKMEANELVRIITKNVNGGYNGLNERQKAYKRIKNENIFKDFE